MRNTPYALRTYLQTYDNTVSKYVPLELFPDQVALLEDYEKYKVLQVTHLLCDTKRELISLQIDVIKL